MEENEKSYLLWSLVSQSDGTWPLALLAESQGSPVMKLSLKNEMSISFLESLKHSDAAQGNRVNFETPETGNYQI